MKAVQADALFDFGGELNMVVGYGRIAPHIVSALNESYPIDPPINP